MEKVKALFSRSQLMLIAIVMLWFKTYILYKVGFKINTTNTVQEFLLFINPLSSAMILFGFCLFFGYKNRNTMIVVISFLSTCVLYFNLLYYRFFSDFLTLPVLFQTSNAKDISGSVIELARFVDVLLFADVLLLTYLILAKKVSIVPKKKWEPVVMAVLATGIFFTNITLAQIERPQLLTRSFDREMLVQYIGTFNYHVYDAVMQTSTKAQRVFAESSDILEVKQYTKSKELPPDPELFGIAEGKNVIVISLESLQTFVINNTLYGEEVTPFLNRLIEDSYYFDNFYHQTAQGKTSDSEFLLDTSLFGRSSGAVFFTHSGNEYQALPETLGKHGYFTSVMHANNRSFWNRDLMYNSLGYDHFYDIEYYDVHDENSVGWGLKDYDFFEQSIDLLKNQPEPYYTKLITLTNHFPFELGEEDRLIPEYHSNSRTLNRYFPTVRYMDMAFEHFFDRLKEEGIYENSIFIIYGDHYGISENHNRAMSMYLEKEEITPFDTVQLQRVPLYIHIPGHRDNEVKNTVSGQIDLKPTIMHLVGLSTKNYVHFGSDLFSPNRESFVVLRDGSHVTEYNVQTRGVCYRKRDGAELDPLNCSRKMKEAEEHLAYSDRVVLGDLLRFAAPK
ncbi:LTA synthase family protein [Bacillus alkalicellulosilyticus]|uniref:LTA synthase family protein n=1 Tax=Alkalihalobacterium alkalicellulosilyticum TaxID=1912214 RepID=UPI00099729F0|nr:LTA synthase family protein [Bacillus alkalicellulosilyticus]